MPRYRFRIDGRDHEVEVEGGMPLLWVLRDVLGLTSTKYSCGIGVCGACTVLEGDEPVRSCVLPAESAAGRSFVTLEGLDRDGAHPVQVAWVEEDVSQCGFCQPGMMLRAAALLERTPRPTDADIDAAFFDHLCRCGTYARVRRAVHRAAELAAGSSERDG